MRKIAAGAACLLLGVTLVLAVNAIRTEAASRKQVAARDAWVERQLATGSAAPARGWLDNPRHGTYAADPLAMRQLVRDFHTAGATRVFVIGIQRLGKRELADTVGVLLPSGGLMREQLFEIASRVRKKPVRDTGQRYLTVSVN